MVTTVLKEKAAGAVQQMGEAADSLADVVRTVAGADQRLSLRTIVLFAVASAGALVPHHIGRVLSVAAVTLLALDHGRKGP